MKRLKKTVILAIIATVVISMSAFEQASQNSDKPKNLKVLPKNTSNEEIGKIMREFNVALGVKCNFCHAAKPNGEKGMDFASDSNPHKNIARQMMKMTQKINKKHFNKPHEGILQNISCNTCHNGQKEPSTIKIQK